MTSIQRHMTAWLLLAVVSLATLGNVILYFQVRNALRREFDRRLAGDARAFSRLIAYDEKARMELEIPAAELHEFRAGNRPAYFEIWKPDGTLFYRSPSLDSKDLAAQTPDGAFAAVLPDGRDGRATLIHFVPHRESDEPPPPGEPPATQQIEPPAADATLILAYDIEDMQAFLHYLILGLTLATLALAALCAAIVFLAARRGLRPLHALAEEATAFNPSHLARRFDLKDMPRELTPIVARLNDLLDRIRAAFDRERRFTSSAAHELRTPIAELRACAEVALRLLDSNTPPSVAELKADLEEALAISRQMEHLTQALLLMARSGNPPPLDLKVTNLAPIIDAALAPHQSQCQARALTIDIAATPPSQVRTDPTLLQALLRNLLGNAVAYAPQGSTIHIRAAAADLAPVIEIENQAPDLKPHDIPRLFEPFWRKDAARTSGEHSGLGLPVAEAYSRALGLSLHLSLSDRLHFLVQIKPTAPVPQPASASASQ